MRLDDLLKEFKYEMKIKGLTERTIKTNYNCNARMFRYFENEFKITTLEEIRVAHIKHYINYLQNLKRSEIYINSILKYVRSFFKYCINEEYIKENPINKISFLKAKQTVIETFNDREVNKMLKVWSYKSFYEARNKAIIALLFESGIRNLELCSLNMLSVRESIIKIIGKGNKERYVPISPALKKILIKYERMRTGYIKDKFIIEDAYFLTHRGNRMCVNSIERIVKKTGEAAQVRTEIRCSPHTCRHYYAQFLLKQDVDIYTVSRLLGHAKLDITRVYLQSLKDQDIVELSKMKSPLMTLKF